MENEYRMVARTGQIVLLPNGTPGIINHWDILNGGNTKEVRVFPFTNWLHRLYLTLTGKTWFYDDQINRLKPLYIPPIHLEKWED